MQFSNTFEVSLPPEQAWPMLLDVEKMVPCMPGAELLERRDDKHFKGRISVRLGPVALSFVCDAAFEEVDNDGHRALIRASGADAKGRGNADATIVFRMQPSAIGAKVIIETDLNLTGVVAQYGRGAGMMQSVANQIVSQFAKNLEAYIERIKAAGVTTTGNPASGASAAATASANPSATPLPPPQPAKPISGFSLIFSSLWATIRGWFVRGPAH